jgi:hypothetical protein
MNSLGIASQGLLGGASVRSRYIATQGLIEGVIIVIGPPQPARTVYADGAQRLVYADDAIRIVYVDGSSRTIFARDE